MNYDIVPKLEKYKGVERVLLATDILNKKTRKIYSKLLEEYFNILNITLDNPTSTGLSKLIDFSKSLLCFDIDTEVVIYEQHPLDYVFDYEIELLGIDIVYDTCESLLKDTTDENIMKVLNENGLCFNQYDANILLPSFNNSHKEIELCYVYKIKQSPISEREFKITDKL